jgi:uncharacterized membrane protein
VSYAFAKWVHIVSSTILFGTGVGSAFYLLAAVLGRDARVIARIAAWVVRADWLFTATTAVLQPLSGWYLVRTAGFAWSARWLALSTVLYGIAIACWLPVVWLQMRMRDLARGAAESGGELPPAFRRCLRAWIALGVPALAAFLAIFYLMVAKPA